MQLHMLKGKVHRATITGADLNYPGSLTLDPVLREAAGMLVHERVQVLNCNTGDRFETYIIDGEPGSGDFCLNGAAARLGQKGDICIALTYVWLTEAEAKEWQPKLVYVDEHNRITHVGHEITRASEGVLV